MMRKKVEIQKDKQISLKNTFTHNHNKTLE